jgi:thiol-disulfide isomerase/thioredoxin
MEPKEQTGKKSIIKIKVFGKTTCEACKAVKDKFNFFLNHWGLSDQAEIIYIDLDTVEGLSQGAYFDALEFPTTILEKNGLELARWKKTVPTSQEFKKFFEGDSV